MSQYVCAFRGRRDNYQIPLALAEQDRLDQFITDFYALDRFREIAAMLPRIWHDKILFRYKSDLPANHVRCLWNTALCENTRHLLGFSRHKTFSLLDRNFSLAAAARAKQSKSNLLLYTPYAWEAFHTSYRHNPHRILFEYHPHPQFQTHLLKKDLKRFPFVEQSFREETGAQLPHHLQIRIQDCWKHADLILCASNFTRLTLLEAGVEASKCQVITYGVDLPELSWQVVPRENFQALFIGSGSQRKGLHHLISAWKQANLPEGSKLILVCRILDPGIKALIGKAGNIELINGADTSTLHSLYRTSSLFVMPSLIEGFGQVFLEALSYGCPVLGTPNTCLPDLGKEENGIFLTQVGDLEHLTYQLEYLSRYLSMNLDIRQKARACSESFSWKNFRNKICQFL